MRRAAESNVESARTVRKEGHASSPPSRQCAGHRSLSFNDNRYTYIFMYFYINTLTTYILHISAGFVFILYTSTTQQEYSRKSSLIE
jgi:hypothetical protein